MRKKKAKEIYNGLDWDYLKKYPIDSLIEEAHQKWLSRKPLRWDVKPIDSPFGLRRRTRITARQRRLNAIRAVKKFQMECLKRIV